ncbi:MAG: glycosyltransferase family 39 protein [Candidatus Zixiibacteriota bacterium]
MTRFWTWTRRHPAAAIFTVALLVRLIYLAAIPQPPVAFDARRYVAVGLAAPLAVTNPGLWTDSTARDAVQFPLLLSDLVRDEDVLWFPYTIPSYREALDDLFFTGPVYPAFLGAVFRIAPAWDFWVVRLLQALIDSLSAVMILVLMRRLISPVGGVIAACVWCLYGPALYKIGELNTEALSVCLGLAILLALVRAFDSRGWGWLWIVGLLCGLLALTKASATVLIVPLAAAWIWASRRDLRRGLSGAAIMLVAMAVLMIPWVLAVYWRYGVFAVRDPSYGGANFRQANILQSEGYNLDQAPRDFWTYPVWREMKRHPGQYALLYLQKFDRMWLLPSDDFRRGFPLGHTGTLWLQRALVALALVGFFLWPTRAGPVAWLPVSFVLYFAALHEVMHVVSRYNMVAMPVVAGAAALGGQWLVTADRRGWLVRAARILVTMIAVPVALSLLRPTTWLLLPGLSWQTATVLFWATGATIIGVAAWWVTGVPEADKWLRRRVAGGAGSILILAFLGLAIPREGHADWSIHLDRPDLQVRRSITIPAQIVRDSVEMGVVLVDVLPDRGQDCGIILGIGAREAVYSAQELMSEETFYSKASYRVFLSEYGEQVTDVRRWTMTKLDSAMLDSLLAEQRVTITVAVDSDVTRPGGLRVYGDLPVADQAHWSGPGIEMTTLERYYEAGDPRVWTEQPLDFTTATSELVRDGLARIDDLSTSWGRQVGQYRLFFALLMWDGRWRYF